MTHKILVLHGPNMNLLGTRDESLYGSQTIEELNKAIADEAAHLGLEVMIEQSNSEGQLIDMIHHHCTGDSSSPGKAQGLIINPAAYSHYSYAIREAIDSISIPAVEVHMTNPAGRVENFRHNFVTGAVCTGIISGFGADSYLLALRAINRLLS